MRDTYGLRSAVRPVAFALTCFGFASAAIAQPTPAVDPAASPTAAPQPDVEAPKAATEAAPLPPAAPEVPPPPPAAAPAPEAPKADPNSGNVSFKPGKGLDIKSNDGNFALKLQVKAQLLDEVNKVKSAPKATNDFIVRRLRLALGGNVFSPNVKYKVELTFAAQELGRTQAKTAESVIPGDSMAMPPKPASAATLDRDLIAQSPLLDAYFDFTHLRDLSVRVGQSKVPFGRERMLSDNEMIVVDRSLEDTQFNFDRDMGIDIRSNDFLGLNLLHYYLGVWAAEDRNATFNSLGRGDLGLLYNARVELVPLGNFEEVAGDFDRNAPKLSIGAAYAFLQTDGTSPYAGQSLGGTISGTKLSQQAKIDYNVHNITADLLFKAAGFSVLGAFHYRKANDLPDVMGIKARNGLGFTAQAGYIVSADVPLEVYGMYGMIRQVKKATSNLKPNNEAGGGVTYYFNRQGLKLQAELARIWYQDAGDKISNDTRFRLQLQVML